jgi:hypothetical protein
VEKVKESQESKVRSSAMSEKAAVQTRKEIQANVGPGDQTVAELLNPGSAFLDYYAQNGPTTLTVFFMFNGAASATVQVDFGPQQPLSQGSKQFTFKEALQLAINNQSGQVKYGWAVVQ